MGLSFLIRCPLELVDLLFVCGRRFAECLSLLHMNALTWEAFKNHPGNPTPQEGMRLDTCNSEFAREPIAMKTFMREVSY